MLILRKVVGTAVFVETDTIAVLLDVRDLLCLIRLVPSIKAHVLLEGALLVLANCPSAVLANSAEKGTVLLRDGRFEGLVLPARTCDEVTLLLLLSSLRLLRWAMMLLAAPPSFQLAKALPPPPALALPCC